MKDFIVACLVLVFVPVTLIVSAIWYVICWLGALLTPSSSDSMTSAVTGSIVESIKFTKNIKREISDALSEIEDTVKS